VVVVDIPKSSSLPQQSARRNPSPSVVEAEVAEVAEVELPVVQLVAMVRPEAARRKELVVEVEVVELQMEGRQAAARRAQVVEATAVRARLRASLHKKQAEVVLQDLAQRLAQVVEVEEARAAGIGTIPEVQDYRCREET
jgi:hypothetical protein